MRIAVLAASAAAMFLGGCGGTSTSRTKNAQANTEKADASLQMKMMNAAPGAMVMPTATPSKDEALKVMKLRHDAMEALGKSMKELHRQLDSSVPDINAIRAQTSAMAAAGTRVPMLFPPGTGPDVSKTRAKPEIWKQPDLFIRRAKEYLAAAQAIDAAAKAGDVNKVMALHDNVDKACKACHDPFRAPEH
jgi:cytochrome c556